MAAIISFKSIQQVVSSLPYPSSTSLKSRLIQAVMQYYTDAESVRTLHAIPADALIQTLWSTGDHPDIIRKKQKNLSSVRSSVNIDLKKLAADGLNPDGLQLSNANIFVMSEEAKDKALDAILNKMPGDTPASLDEIAKVLQMVDGMLSNLEANGTIDTHDRQHFVAEMKTVIDEITEKVSSDGFLSGENPGVGIQEPKNLSNRGAAEGKSDQAKGSGRGEGDDELKGTEFANDIDLEELEFSDEIDTKEHTIVETGLDGEGPGASSGLDPDGDAAGAGSTKGNLAGSEDSRAEPDGDGSTQTEDAAGKGHGPGAGLGAMTSSAELEAEPVDDQELPKKDDDDVDVHIIDAEDPADEDELEELEFVDDADLPGEGGEGHGNTGQSGSGKQTSDVEATHTGQGQNLASIGGESESGSGSTAIGTESLAGSETGEAEPGRGDDGVEGGSVSAIDPETMPIDAEEIEEVDDDDVDLIDEDHKLEFMDDGEPVESAGDGGESGLGGSGATDGGGAGTASDEVPEGSPDGLDGEQYSAGDTPDRVYADNQSADNGLDRVEAIGVEDMPDWSQSSQKARLLAEEFNRSLAAMDKFYNQYVKIPAGNYVVGSPRSNGKQKQEEALQLPEYYIGKFPVTNALFELFIEKTGYQTTAEKQGFGTVYTGRSQHIRDPQTGQEHKIWHADIQCQTVSGACWYQPRGPGSTIHKKRNHPVVQVSLQDSMAFAAWTGKRLPSEAEWEAAARTADSRVYPWGNTWQSHGCNSEESGNSDTTPVDCFLDFMNKFGVADTLGNVLEWTSCTVNGNAKNNQSAYYIVKGGSWISGSDLRLYSQFQQTADGHSNLLGFRCVAF